MSQFKILSVEDQAPLRQALSILLESEGMEVQTTIHGQDALEALMGGYEPDVILVDNQMPVMGGIELIQRLKDNPNYRDIPVVFLSAQNESNSIITALRCGAIDYITKPYDPEDLFKRLQRAYQIGKQLQLAQTADAQLQGLQKHWGSLVKTAYMELHLTDMEEIESVSRLLSGFFDESLQPQITVGLLEALSNAVMHGNFDISSEIREHKNGYANLQKELAYRKTLPEYKDRKVVVIRKIEEDTVTYSITDDGNGFDISTIVDPRKPENVTKKTGRGILLMKVYFDEVVFNEKGNSVTLIKTL